LSYGSLRYFGIYGYGWSSISVTLDQITSASAYFLNFYESSIDPSYGPLNRWYGFPIRCLM